MECLRAILDQLQLSTLDIENASDIKLDLGKPIKLVYPDGFKLLDQTVTHETLDALKILLPPFDKLHRTGFDGSLHRISGIFNVKNELIGLTIRLARELKDFNIPLIPWLNRGHLILGPPA